MTKKLGIASAGRGEMPGPRDGLGLVAEQVGLALLACQVAEVSIKRCVAWAFPSAAGAERGGMHAQKDEPWSSKQTLGALLNQLREQVKIDGRFDAELDEFRERRNVLVHGFARRFALEKTEGILAGYHFARGVRLDAHRVGELFRAVTFATADAVLRQHGWDRAARRYDLAAAGRFDSLGPGAEKLFEVRTAGAGESGLAPRRVAHSRSK